MMIEQKILDSLLAGYWDWNVVQDKVFLSDRLKAILGYLPDEIDDAGDSIRSLIIEEDHKVLAQAVQEHLHHNGQKPFDIEVRYRHHQGHIVWIHCTGSTIEWQEGKPVRIVGCHVDITRQKEAEAQLEQEKNLMNDFFEVNLDLMGITDTEGRLLRFNPRWEQVLGYSRAELSGCSLLHHVHPEDYPVLADTLFRMQPTESFQLVNRFRRVNGSYRHLEWKLLRKEDCLYISGKDVTVRVRAIQALTEAKQLNSIIVQSLSEGILFHDTQGRIIESNEAAMRIMGLNRAQFAGQEALPDGWHLCKEDGAAYGLHERPDFVALYQGKASFGQVLRIQQTGRPERWILANSVPILDDRKTQVRGVISSFADITDIKAKEARLSTTLRQALDQKNTLENFAHMVSHNLRSYANNIHSLVQMFEDTDETTEKDLVWGYLKKAACQFRQTIQDLNEITDAKRAKEIQLIMLRAFVYQVLDNLIVDLQNNLADIRVDIPEEFSLPYKPAYLESILLNFITNALKYRHPDRTPVIAIRARQVSSQTILEIEDNGIGIDLALHGEKLFGLYKTFHDKPDAKGIGLYITKTQIEDMGGHIEVRSTVNQGTTFVLYLNAPNA